MRKIHQYLKLTFVLVGISASLLIYPMWAARGTHAPQPTQPLIESAGAVFEQSPLVTVLMTEAEAVSEEELTKSMFNADANLMPELLTDPSKLALSCPSSNCHPGSLSCQQCCHEFSTQCALDPFCDAETCQLLVEDCRNRCWGCLP